MTSPSAPFSITRTVAVEPEVLFGALTQPAIIQAWLCTHAFADARPTGAFFWLWPTGYYASGHFHSVDPTAGLRFAWQGRGDPGPSEVAIAWQPVEEGLQISVTYDLGDGPRWEATRETISRLWTEGLENLESVLRQGVDLRIARRPMLGISGGYEVTPEVAAREGHAVQHGLSLDGVVPGLGAELAGLRKGDILLRMDDVPLYGWASLAGVVQGHRAGDELPVEFMRDGAIQAGRLRLSARPIAPLPPSIEALHEALQETYSDLDNTLDAIFEGVSDERASQQPWPGEWSPKEVLAHLIATERALHTLIAMSTEEVIFPDNWVSNAAPYIAAVLRLYPSLAELTDELKRAEAITREMIRSYPGALVNPRILRHLTEQVAEGIPFHTRLHFRQIQEALATATP